MLVLSVCSVTAIKRFARESLRDCGEAVQNKWLFFQVAQHGALVEALLTTSSCLNLTKKKRQSIFCMLLKKMYVNPSSILMFTGLGSCYLFLFSFPAQPWGAVFSPTCLAALHALLPRAVQCPRWDGMSARTRRGGICVWGCECCCTDRNPRVGPNFLWTLHSSKEMGEIPIGASVCAWQGALVHEGKPCAAELDRNTHGSSFAWCF